MMVAFFVVANFAGSDDEAEAKMRAGEVSDVTAPVGQVRAVGEEPEEEMTTAVATTDADAGGEASGDVGETVYGSLCVNCHGIAAMAAMIPQTGDAAAWEPRIAKGIEALYNNAINGFTGDMGMMPARGSNPTLSDDEVKAAVDYMVKQVQ
ncbi:MAG: cytochrome c5 family protein [Proteobacteria bacterium]|nr:cytochrome c5 family protein [Pseudomonadota bacterium]NOG60575.1 cytochrome c5 family protein [Pseudomonadota bacterium]